MEIRIEQFGLLIPAIDGRMIGQHTTMFRNYFQVNDVPFKCATDRRKYSAYK